VNLRLLSYNIRYGGVGREDAIAGAIRIGAPDLVILEEATRPEVVRKLAAATGLPHYGSQFGESVAFLSRVDIAKAEWRALMLARRKYLELVTASGLRIFGVHLSAIHSNITEQRRTVEVRALLKEIAPYRDTFHLLAGDFNTLAQGTTFDASRLPARLRALYWLGGGKIRWRALQLMIEGGYADAYRALHQDDGYTFPTWDPQVRLDYVFLPKERAGYVKACRVLYDAPRAKEASDHFPLLAELSI
jgi:endonuclease/exonuclease/phosphatase family metal-dependent hydrolase